MATARGLKAGNAFVELSLDSTKFQAGIELAQRRLQSVGSDLVNVGARLGAIGAAGVAGFFPAIKAASDFQETVSKFDTVFGDRAGAVRAFSDELANQLGRSKAQMLSFMAASQDLFVPIGFDSAAAEEMSKQIARLAVDLGSFNNIADEDVMRDLQAAMTGSGEVMKKYGVIVSEAAVKQELLNKGIDPASAKETEKVMARLSIIMAGTTAAQGDAIRTSGGFANQMKRISSAGSDAAVAIGQALLPTLTQIINAINAVNKPIQDWIANNGELIRTVFAVAAGVSATGVAITAVGVGMIALGKVIGVALAPFKILGTSISVVLPLLTALLNPIGLVVVAVGALAYAFRDQLGQFTGVFDSVAQGVRSLVTEFQGSVQAMGAALANGDVESAGRVLWATLQLQWAKGVGALNSTWTEWRSFFVRVWTEAVSDLAGVFLNGTAALRGAWVTTTGFFVDSWTNVVTALQVTWLKIENIIATGILKLRALFDRSFDLSGAVSELNSEFVAKQEALTKGRDGKIAERRAERDAQLKQIQAEQQGALEALASDKQTKLDAIDQGELKAIGQAQEELNDARLAWADAVKQAAVSSEKVNPFGEQVAANAAKAKAEDIVKSETPRQLSTLGGARAGQIFGVAESPLIALSKKQVANQEKQITEAQKTRKALESGGLVFG